MNYQDILKLATVHLQKLIGRNFDILDIKKPLDIEYANHLAKVVSKISPIMGNMIEYEIVKSLNEEDWKGLGKWKRQDPGFPDAIFLGDILPFPGIEVKTWFPLATEITARFKDSVLHFEDDQTLVAVVAWLPEYIIYGKPHIVDVWVGSAKSLATIRDKHYHKAPDYLVFEPEDTTARTSNLQQTNVNGYKFQGSPALLEEAREEMKKWEGSPFEFNSTPEYQQKIKSLLGRYPYRLDTNFAKIDRINHGELEKFKTQVLKKNILGKNIMEWSKVISSDTESIYDLLSTLVTE